MRRFYFLISVLILFSCNSNKKEMVSHNQELNYSIIQNKGNKTDFNRVFEKINEVEFKPDKKHFITEISEIIVASSNYIVADRVGKQLLIFERTGRLKNTIGKTGTGPGEFKTITSIDINNKNEILLLDNTSWKVLKYKLNGEFIRSYNVNGALSIIADLEGGFYLYNPLTAIKPIDTYLIKHYGPKGKISNSFCKPFFEFGLGDGWLEKDKENNLYVIQDFSYKVQKYSIEGKLISEIGIKTKYYKPFKLKNDKTLPPLKQLNASTGINGIAINSKYVIIQYQNFEMPYKFSWLDIYNRKGDMLLSGIKTVLDFQLVCSGDDDLFYFIDTPNDDISSDIPNFHIVGYELNGITK